MLYNQSRCYTKENINQHNKKNVSIYLYLYEVHKVCNTSSKNVTQEKTLINITKQIYIHRELLLDTKYAPAI